MKKIAFITLTCLFCLIFSVSQASAKKEKKEVTKIFKVNMDCEGCVKKIQSNISYEKGVKDLTVSLEDKECKVTFREDKTSAEKLVKAFTNMGYEAEVVEEPEKKKAEAKE